MSVGKVFLIGAGPGDPGLLTLRGAEALARADVVLFDALAHPALLEHAREGAELRPVGKRYGEPSPEQAAINAELVELALAGKTVARLKGGDPLLFARGAEEAEALAARGIPFEIVPGVPSVTAAAAFAGISLTHRDLSSSVAIVTGTETPGKQRSAHDWKRLATATHAIAFVMAMKRIDEIARSLVEHGRAPETPVVVVQWASWPRQRVVEGTLADIVERAAAAGATNPAIVFVGEVARLRDTLRWFDVKPLFGKRVLVTRAAEQAGDTAKKLRERGADPIVVPVIEIVDPPDPAAFSRLCASFASYDAVAMTSANTVVRVFRELEARGRDARAFGGAVVAAIGPGTSAALAARGVRADVVAKEFRGEGLADALLAAIPATEGRPRRVALPRAKVAREALPEALRAAGCEVDVVPAYETRPATGPALDGLARDLEAGAIDAALFTSSSTVDATCDALGARAVELLSRTVVASIGPITSATARKRGLTVSVEAAAYTLDGLLAALEAHFAETPAS